MFLTIYLIFPHLQYSSHWSWTQEENGSLETPALNKQKQFNILDKSSIYMKMHHILKSHIVDQVEAYSGYKF